LLPVGAASIGRDLAKITPRTQRREGPGERFSGDECPFLHGI
jgi:hypothetical protein